MCDASHASPSRYWWMLTQSLATAGAVSKAYVGHTPNSRRTVDHRCRLRHLRTGSSRRGASGLLWRGPGSRSSGAECRHRKPRRTRRACSIGAVIRTPLGLTIFRAAVLRTPELPAAARVGSKIPVGNGLPSARTIDLGPGLSSQHRGRRTDRRHHRLAAIDGVSNARSSPRAHPLGIGCKHRVAAGGQEGRPICAMDQPPHEPRRGHARSARPLVSRDRHT